MLKNRNTIIYLGFNYFPFGFAPGERQKLISKALIENGYRVVIIARRGSLKKTSVHLPYKGKIEGIHYMYTSGTAYRPKSFLKRNLLKIYGVISEFFLIASLCTTSKVDYVFIYSRVLILQRYYYFLSRIFKFKIVTDYTEKASAWAGISKNFDKFERYSPIYTHGSFCISDYLMQATRDINPSLPLLKVPVICDLQKIQNLTPKTENHKYFLFCGTLFYQEVIEFIVDSFLLCQNKNVNLFLVVNGGDKQREFFTSYIDKCPKKAFIRTFSDLEYDQLIGLYKGAEALLIPLRSTIQDIARFPHKIGEYTASGRPIITTNVGEIPLYFSDMHNALISDDITPGSFKEKMDFVIKNPAEADRIGQNGMQAAAQHFDYHAIGKTIVPFLKKL